MSGFIYPNKVDQLQFIEAMVRTQNLLPRIPRDVMYYIWKNCFLMDVFERLKEIRMERFGNELVDKDEISQNRYGRYKCLYQRVEFYWLLRQPSFYGIVRREHIDKRIGFVCFLDFGLVSLKSGNKYSHYTFDLLKDLLLKLENGNKIKRKKLIV
jgi:hypothetical protein